MAKLTQSKDPLLYSIDSLIEDDDWGYMFSYSFQSPEKDDESENKGFDTLHKEMQKIRKSAADNDISESFEGILDIKRELFLKLRREGHEGWERKVAQFCAQMKQSAEGYYDRKAATFFEIALSSDMDRNPGSLLGKTNGTTPLLEEIAFKPWIFPTLPGTNPALNWPDSLPELYRRVNELKPLSLWSEPFDESYSFQDAVYAFIQQAAEKAKSDAAAKEHAKLAFLTALKVAMNSGSYDRMVYFLIIKMDS